MHFTSERRLDDAVLEREFSLGEIPGILWTPASAPGSAPAPLILLGHPPIGLRKMYPRLVARARRSAAEGFATATIELPGSGERPRWDAAEQARADLRRAMAAGEPVSDDIVDALILPLVEKAVPEWQAALDALLALPDISGPVGYPGGVISIGIRARRAGAFVPARRARMFRDSSKEYLAGFRTVRYDVEPEDGLESAKSWMAPVIRADCKRDIGGDEQRVHSTSTSYSRVTYKLVLLPVWFLTCLHAGRAWPAAVQRSEDHLGVAGRCAADRPGGAARGDAAQLRTPSWAGAPGTGPGHRACVRAPVVSMTGARCRPYWSLFPRTREPAGGGLDRGRGHNHHGVRSMTGTTEALGGPAAVDDAARSVTRPFYGYAVLANSLFQRGVFVLFLQQRGFSAGQVALLQTLLYLVSGLAELPTGVVADRIGRRAGIVIGQMLTAGCLLGQVAFSDYWLFLALFIAPVIVDNVFNEAVPSRHRASLLSMIAFVESALIGIGYLVLGALMDGLGSSAGMATYAAVPLLACLLWLPVLFRGARVTTEIEKPAGQKAT